MRCAENYMTIISYIELQRLNKLTCKVLRIVFGIWLTQLFFIIIIYQSSEKLKLFIEDLAIVQTEKNKTKLTLPCSVKYCLLFCTIALMINIYIFIMTKWAYFRCAIWFFIQKSIIINIKLLIQLILISFPNQKSSQYVYNIYYIYNKQVYEVSNGIKDQGKDISLLHLFIYSQSDFSQSRAYVLCLGRCFINPQEECFHHQTQ